MTKLLEGLMGLFDDHEIIVQQHAIYQFALRFHAESPTSVQGLVLLGEVIKEEVASGIKEQRFSPHKPVTLMPPDDPDCIYVWTPDEERIYAVKHGVQFGQMVFSVITTMKANEHAV